MTLEDLGLSVIPSVSAQMGIRRPPKEVFDAFVDPSLLTKFWIERSDGWLEQGTVVRWTMNSEGAIAEVRVTEVEPYILISFDWGVDESYSHVKLHFQPWGEDACLLKITETGLSGSGDEIVARAADSTGGFTMVLCALKAFLEHGIQLCAVSDRAPEM